MNELQIVLHSLSEEDRQTLAHELLAVLEGRIEGASDEREKASEEDRALKNRETFALMTVGTSEGPHSAESIVERKQRADRVQQIQEPENSRLLPEETEQRLWAAARFGEEERFTVLRRGVPKTEKAQEIEFRSSLSEESSQLTAYRQMREISEYFRQDSRRYDAGFTRY